MRKHTWDQRRDATVHLLARLSLVAVLAVLGALFVGGATTSEASESTVGAATGSSAQAVLDQARPIGLLLAALVIGGGLVVLVIGAVKTPAGTERRVHPDLVDQ